MDSDEEAPGSCIIENLTSEEMAATEVVTELAEEQKDEVRARFSTV